jgi:hypothetical protein
VDGVGLCLIVGNRARVRMKAGLEDEAPMRHRKGISIAILVAGLILIGVEIGLWTKTIAPARTETDKQNIEGHHPPNEIPAIAGMCLLVTAAVIASIPTKIRH